MKCQLCRRENEVSSDLCRFHTQAKAALEEGYSAWNYAYGELSRSEYLDRIKRNQETGQWVKEVVGLILGGESS